MKRRHASKGQTAAARGSRRLRIIGGEFRHRLLPVIERPGLRPTPDRVRETLFNWLAGVTPGARVLDLCAGTGALGLEALSRGAAEALLVESDTRVAAALGDNLAALGIGGDRARIVRRDAARFLAGPPRPFDLVFLDPPFHQAMAAPCCAALASGWLAKDAWVYVETEAGLTLEVPPDWSLHREVRAGHSHGRLYHCSQQ